MAHHHLVDHDLREQRRGETDELDGERSDEHVAPDRAVLEQLGDEPAEAERPRLLLEALHRLFPRALVRDEDDRRLEELLEVVRKPSAGQLAARLDVQDALAVVLEDQTGDRVGGLIGAALGHRRAQKGYRRKRGRFEPSPGEQRLTCAEAVGAQRFEKQSAIVRRRKLLQQQRGVERQAMNAAQAADEPSELRRTELSTECPAGRQFRRRCLCHE